MTTRHFGSLLLAAPVLGLGLFTGDGCGNDVADGNSSGDPIGTMSTKGSVGKGGGTVDSLFFAVVGDTRPSLPDINLLYPTAVIDKIFADIQVQSPRPQFVVATGDYMFAGTSGAQAEEQIALYTKAAQQFSGPLFAAMGNHECNGLTNSNCTGKPTANYTAYFNGLVTPLGQAQPYYTIPFTATDGSWTAKLVIVACNAWTSTQQSWLATQLAQPTTYTFVVRHEPAASNTGPCVNDVEALLAKNPYNLSLVGHIHDFQVQGKEVTVGTGGAPLENNSIHGYATVQQTSAGFLVTQYDYATAAPITSTTIPF